MARTRHQSEQGEVAVSRTTSLNFGAEVNIYIQHKTHAGTGLILSTKEARRLLQILPEEICSADSDYEFEQRERERSS